MEMNPHPPPPLSPTNLQKRITMTKPDTDTYFDTLRFKSTLIEGNHFFLGIILSYLKRRILAFLNIVISD